MVTLVVMMAGLAMVLAMVVTALFIAVCLVIAQVTGSGRSRRGVRGGGRARPALSRSAGSRPRGASSVPGAPWPGDR